MTNQQTPKCHTKRLKSCLSYVTSHNFHNHFR